VPGRLESGALGSWESSTPGSMESSAIGTWKREIKCTWENGP